MRLEQFVRDSAAALPDAIAIRVGNETTTYQALDTQADKLAIYLSESGINAGDRVGIWLPKSAFSIIAMQALLRLGAAYVPLDPLAPAARIQQISGACELAAIISNTVLSASLAQKTGSSTLSGSPVFEYENIISLLAEKTEQAFTTVFTDDSALAYILYTSGSTGQPKGICLSHRNAIAFVTWAAQATELSADDRLANHAPFHFDLSVFDIYAAFLKGASVCLLMDDEAASPKKLVTFLNSLKPTVWYSVPSALMLMMDHGDLFERAEHRPRILVFAGEPFPQTYLSRLFDCWNKQVSKGTRFFNFFGPTETNVCLAHEVVSEDFVHSYVPIGRPCSGDAVWLEAEDGKCVSPGETGEIVVQGPTVMQRYWGEEDKPVEYHTGDIAYEDDQGNYHFVGRRDHMVKVRGRRMELNEIEAVLEQHEGIGEAAVVVVGSALEAELHGFITSNANSSVKMPNLVGIKRHCCQRLPHYMAPTEIHVIDSMPRTRNGKIDRQSLTVSLSDKDPVVTVA